MGGRPSVEINDEMPEVMEARASILKIMKSPDWDDGSYAPILIRLAWQSSGTYCCRTGTGGSNGATMRYPLEAGDPENAGLQAARELLEPVKASNPSLSYSDLWVLAAYCAIDNTGGPSIPFQGGRVDKPEDSAVDNGRLPNPEAGLELDHLSVDDEGRVLGWEAVADNMREVFDRMGFAERDLVALICGGHAYGRSHAENSGYEGPWVTNTTFFTNEFAVDLINDSWVLVVSESIMPDGGEVPPEVRPGPDRRQYMNYTKYADAMSTAQATKNWVTRYESLFNSDDVPGFPRGAYVCISDWVNVRAEPSTASSIIARVVINEEVNILCVRRFGRSCRGLLERGGWVSVVASGGKTLFRRRGDVDMNFLVGRYRAVNEVPFFGVPDAVGTGQGKLNRDFWAMEVGAGKPFHVLEVKFGQDEGRDGALFGKLRHTTGWALLFSPFRGQLAELVVDCYNETPRQPLKSQSVQQVRLISDMVLLWDLNFRMVLQEYAADVEVLRGDFGRAFKRLTELGCPWSQDYRAGCFGGG